MIKIVSCLHRLPSLSRQEFQEHWRERHALLLLEIPVLRAYVQYQTVGTNPMSRPKVGDAEPFDGFEVSYWDSLEAFREVLTSDGRYAAAREDRKLFVDAARSPASLVEEKVIVEIEPPAEMALVECHMHRPGQTRADFHASWLSVHGDFGRKIYKTGLMPGYLQNQVVDMNAEKAASLGLDQKMFDGVGFAYYHSAVQLIACANLPIVTKDAYKAEDDFTDQKKLGSVLARRHVLRSCTR
jgi:uncharacterized protein (TIGR02118 family)